MRYELCDWPGIPGRGQFVRLALEAAGADDVGVARRPRVRAHLAFDRRLPFNEDGIFRHCPELEG